MANTYLDEKEDEETNDVVKATNLLKEEQPLPTTPAETEISSKQIFDEYLKLRKERQDALKAAQLSDAIQTGTNIFATAAKMPQYVRETNAMERVGGEKEAQNALQQYVEMRKAEREKNKEPTKIISKTFEDQVGNPLVESQGKLYNLDNTPFLGTPRKRAPEITPYQSGQLEIGRGQLSLSEKRQDELEKERKQRESEREENRQRSFNKDVYGVVQDFERDKVVQALNTQELSFTQMDEIIAAIKTGNQVGIGALGTKAARAMGEVGVLTDQDVKRYIEAASVIRGAQDKFGKAWKGSVSQQTLKDIGELSDKMKNGFAKKREELTKKYVDRAYENFGKNYGFSYGEVKQRFFPQQQIDSKAREMFGNQTEEKIIVEKDGKQFRLPKRQKESAISQGYKVIKE